MTEMYPWVETNGGSHLLIPEEFLSHWRGIEGWYDNADPADTSDYARACRTKEWLGVLPCGEGNALVLSGDVGPIAWLPDADKCGGLLIQRVAFDEEKDVVSVLNASNLDEILDGPNSECVEYATGPSGALRLLDAAEPGNNIQGDSACLKIAAGKYRARAGYLEAAGLMLVVRELSRTA